MYREEQFSVRLMKGHVLANNISWRLANCTLGLTLQKLAACDLELTHCGEDGSNSVEQRERSSDNPGLSQNLDLICETLKAAIQLCVPLFDELTLSLTAQTLECGYSDVYPAFHTLWSLCRNMYIHVALRRSTVLDQERAERLMKGCSKVCSLLEALRAEAQQFGLVNDNSVG
jgi:hypothetical protein